MRLGDRLTRDLTTAEKTESSQPKAARANPSLQKRQAIKKRVRALAVFFISGSEMPDRHQCGDGRNNLLPLTRFCQTFTSNSGIPVYHPCAKPLVRMGLQKDGSAKYVLHSDYSY